MLLNKDGTSSHAIPVLNNVSTDYIKHKDDMLAVIAGSLNKIESHLSKISKVASSLLSQQTSFKASHATSTNVGSTNISSSIPANLASNSIVTQGMIVNSSNPSANAPNSNADNSTNNRNTSGGGG